MSRPAKRILFIDRDGTLIEEPADQQVDRIDKIRLLPDVIPALLKLQAAGYELVVVSNQDGLGTNSFPEADFLSAQNFMRELFTSQGIHFAAEFFCPHFSKDECECRKPKTGLLTQYMQQNIDLQNSYVIGDRDTDLQLAANLGLQGIRIATTSHTGATWYEIAERLSKHQRVAEIMRKTKETDIKVIVNLDQEMPIHIDTGLGFFDHMLEQIARHGGFSLQLTCKGDLHIDEHHTIEDCALALGQALRTALGDKKGIGRYGFLLAMDESLAQVAIDLSGRAYFTWEGEFGRDQIGQLPTELVPHFFRSLSDTLAAAINIKVTGDNTHHMIEACFKGMGRALRQAFRIEGTELPSSKGVL
ncbi:MAG: bifunctional histidinol-phosphatase/imidazoleglycerol-phosphate dehydratase HisB [Steroidobacteraceae bacterium]